MRSRCWDRSFYELQWITEDLQSNRRMVTLSLTREGEEAASGVAEVEAALHGTISEAFDGDELSGAIAALRRLVAGRPAGEALARRSGLSHLP